MRVSNYYRRLADQIFPAKAWYDLMALFIPVKSQFSGSCRFLALYLFDKLFQVLVGIFSLGFLGFFMMFVSVFCRKFQKYRMDKTPHSTSGGAGGENDASNLYMQGQSMAPIFSAYPPSVVVFYVNLSLFFHRNLDLST